MKKLYFLSFIIIFQSALSQKWSEIPNAKNAVIVENNNITSKVENSTISNQINTSGKVTDINYHDTKGAIEVSGSGELNFNLPITLPPGIKSVAPQINLIYGSNVFSGIAGIGWNVSGLSSISRVGRNIEKDGEVKGLKYDYTDLYQFNGQRLILVSGEYGKDGATYSTEQFSNLRIKSIGSSGDSSFQGPAGFEVTFENGTQALYGLIVNTYNHHEYDITKWTDADGNFITYDYLMQDNVIRINTIRWGGNVNKGTAHFNKIEFHYSTKNIKQFAYANGIKSVQNYLLDVVFVYANNNLFRRYGITYTSTPNGAQHEIVSQITESVNGSEARPITFQRQTSEDNLITATVAKYNPGSLNDVKNIMGDFDGDGKVDIMKYVPYQNTGYWTEDSNSCNGRCGDERWIEGVEEEAHTEIRISGLDTNYSVLNVSDIDLTKKALPATLLTSDSKTMQKQALINFSESKESLSTRKLKIDTYSLENGKMLLAYSKEFPSKLYDLTYVEPHSGPNVQYIEDNYYLNSVKEVDINSDGISELVLVVERNLTRHNFPDPDCYTLKTRPDLAGRPVPVCTITTTDPPSYQYYILNPNPNNTEPIYNLGISFQDEIFSKGSFTDVDGDGLQEISLIENNFINVYGFKKLVGNQYSFEIKQNFTKAIEGVGNGYFGDLNGDGKTDLLIPYADYAHPVYNFPNITYPTTWNTYLSNGKTFENKQSSQQFGNYMPDEVATSGQQTHKYEYYYTKDINRDGLLDFIKIKSWYWKPGANDPLDASYGIEIYENRGLGTDNKISYVKTYDLQPEHSGSCYNGNCSQADYPFNPLVGNFRIDNQENFLLLIHGPDLLKFTYYDSTERARLTSIEQGGLKTDINYKYLDDRADSEFYKGTNNLLYPYTVIERLPQTKAVYSLNQEGITQKFKYRGLVSNAYGRGFIGFFQTARSNFYFTSGGTPIWTAIQIDPLLDGLPAKSWSTKNPADVFPTNISETNDDFLTYSKIDYLDKTIGQRKVKLPSVKFEKDFTTNTVKSTTTTYDNTYFLPEKVVVDYDTGFASSTTDFSYYNNEGIGVNYFIGRPKSKIESMTAYGDTKKTKEEFIYEGNILKKTRNFAHNLLDYIEEEYTYDGWGNITQKTVSSGGVTSSPGEVPVTTKTEYEPLGRFVNKTIDNLNVPTFYDYDDLGFLVFQKDIYNNTLTNTYDNWGKLIQGTSSLNGTNYFTYKKFEDGSSFQKTVSADGDENTVYIDKKGQNYKTVSKSFNSGKYVAVDTEFDLVGKKTKFSEPHYEEAPATKWNTITYDNLSRPITNTLFNGRSSTTSYQIRTVVVTENTGRYKKKTVDGLGNVKSSEDNGGVINFSYNAAGQQILASFQGNDVETSYDKWGRKDFFSDPSNGEYSYNYDSFGKILLEKSPLGAKEYKYYPNNLLYQVKETSDDGTSTFKNYTIVYSSVGQVVSKSGTANQKNFSNTLTYDSKGRISSQLEQFENKKFFKNSFAFDNIGRISSYKQGLESSGSTTQVQIENSYSVWSGDLYQIKEKGTNKILWELQSTNDIGQVISNKLGASQVTNTYDAFGFMSKAVHVSSLGQILNNDYIFNAQKNELNYRKNNILDIVENFKYDEDNIPLNRLTSWTDPVTGSLHQNSYDNKGRITKNYQLGDFSYEGYKATSLKLNTNGLKTYGIGKKGTGTLLQTVSYNENNDPVKIEGTKSDYAFNYGLSESRQIMSFGGKFEDNANAQFTKYYSEDGSMEIIRNNQTGTEKHTLFIGGSPYESTIVSIKDFGTSVQKFYFLHKDYIGSVLAISDETGKAIEQRHFDAWGNFTHLKANNAVLVGSQLDLITSLFIDRGYTSHEHLLGVKLIHMNGRLYDPLLRRFLNADENIQDPENTQIYNKYGYVANNPLLYNDPSGEIFGIDDLTIGGAILIAAIIGGASYTLGVLIATGSLREWNVFDFAKSVIIGGMSGAATFGIGELFKAGNFLAMVKGVGKFMLQAGMHGVSQGFFALVDNGGNFFQAFVSGGLGSLASSGWSAALGNAGSTGVGMIAFGALAGGIGAELAGGNFFKGFIAGGIVAGLNHLAHKPKSVFDVYDDDGDYIGKIKVLKYNATKNGLEIELGFTSASTKYNDYLWIQSVSTNDHIDFGKGRWRYNDPTGSSKDDNSPFYYTKSELPTISGRGGFTTIFNDAPKRNVKSTNIWWRAELSLTGRSGNNIYEITTLKYGFNLFSTGAIGLSPLISIPYYNTYYWLKKRK